MHVEDRDIEGVPLFEPAQCFERRFGRTRQHAPLGGLQREHAPVGRVVVDDEHALALQLGLHADEIALAGHRQLGDRHPDGEQERSSTPLSVALRPHVPAHQLGEAPADREAQSGTAVFARRRRIGL